MNGHSVYRPTVGFETMGRLIGTDNKRSLTLCRVRRGMELVIFMAS